jgi:hypothetical protein
MSELAIKTLSDTTLSYVDLRAPSPAESATSDRPSDFFVHSLVALIDYFDSPKSVGHIVQLLVFGMSGSKKGRDSVRGSANAVGDEVERLMKNQVCAKTRKDYILYQARLLCALHDMHGTGPQSVVRGAFFEGEGARVEGKASVEWVRGKLRAGYDEAQPPLKFQLFEARHVAEVVLAQNTERDMPLALVTIRSWASAARDLFRCYGVPVPRVYDEDMARITKGYGKEHVDDRPKNCIGKDALPFDALCTLSRHMIVLGTKDMTFARAYALLQWSLMCRSSNTEGLLLKHLEWRGDSMLVYFRKMKNDQDGSRSRDPRSVYGNPLKPEVCCFLALGMYLLCCPPSRNQVELFPGKSQSTRFNMCLGRLLQEKETAGEVSASGYAERDFGSHSLRKGASTFVTSGITDGPSQMAVNLRGGWTMNKVEHTYFRYEKAGDNFVGRCVAGLPVHSAEFAMLPPMFLEKDDSTRQLVASTIDSCFPSVSVAFRAICKTMVASVIYHEDWLRNIAPKHPVFATPLFALDVPALKRIICCKIAGTTDDLQPTGVPAHVSLKVDIVSLREQQAELVKTVVEAKSGLESLRTGFQEDLRNDLNNFFADQGHLTHDGVQGLFESQFAKLGQQLNEVVQRLQGGDFNASAQAQAGDGDANSPTTTMYTWQGRLHPVPETFELPNGPVDQAWIQWSVGFQHPLVPPLRNLTFFDMPSRNMRKRFSDFRKLMMLIESTAKSSGLWPKSGRKQWKERLTIGEARAIFEKVAVDFEPKAKSKEGRSRRISQLSWNTVYKELCVSSKDKPKASRKRAVREDVQSEGIEGDSSNSSISDDGSDAESDQEEGGIDQQPDWNVDDAYERMCQFLAVNNLEIICEVPGDGNCFFHAAIVVLEKVYPHLKGLTHMRVRAACVEYVYQNQQPGTADLLKDLGMDDWDDYKEEMSQSGVYCDFAMVEALAFVYKVRLFVVYAANDVNSRYIAGDSSWPEVCLGNVGDYHFYPLQRREGMLLRGKKKLRHDKE